MLFEVKYAELFGGAVNITEGASFTTFTLKIKVSLADKEPSDTPIVIVEVPD